MNNDLTRVEVNLSNLKNNIKAIQQEINDDIKLLCVVKGNAYGHGLKQAAKTAEEMEVAYLGVSDFAEAKEIREADVTLPVLIMGPSLPEHSEEIISLNLEASISSFNMADSLNQKAKKFNQAIKVQLNVDTGMGRSGVPYSKAFSLYKKLKSFSNLQVNGIFSHLRSAHLQGTQYYQQTLVQINKFNNLLERIDNEIGLPPLCHIASSYGLLHYKQEVTDNYFNLVRVGGGIYGHDIALNQGFAEEYKPALSLKSKILEIKQAEKGDEIGYGGTFTAPEKMTIALIPVGYYHGLSYNLSNRGEVLIKGQRAGIVGEISMNQIVVDVTDIDEANIGDEVEVIGSVIKASEHAKAAKTELCEILVSLSRAPHIFYYED